MTAHTYACGHGNHSSYKHGNESGEPRSSGWCELHWKECKACCTEDWPRCHDFYKGMCLMHGVVSCPLGWHPTPSEYRDLVVQHLGGNEKVTKQKEDGQKPKESTASERPQKESSSKEAKPEAVRKKEKKHRDKSESSHDCETKKHQRKSESESPSREKTRKRQRKGRRICS